MYDQHKVEKSKTKINSKYYEMNYDFRSISIIKFDINKQNEIKKFNHISVKELLNNGSINKIIY